MNDKIYTPEFERWYKTVSPADGRWVKALAWMAWRSGRERMWEEMAHTRLQKVHA
jgi:hypothetical protein